MRYFPNSAGWIEVIIGSMFSGKTTELIRRCDRMKRAGRRVQIFSRDTRYKEDAVVSHDKRSHFSTFAENSADIINNLDWKTDVVAIDEGQFYDDELLDVVKKLAGNGKIVIVAGLDQDYLCKPFSVMQNLVSEAEFVDKLNAVCTRCGNPAIRNFRKASDDERIMLGAEESYEALCRSCYEKAVKQLKQEELF